MANLSIESYKNSAGRIENGSMYQKFFKIYLMDAIV